MLSKGQTEPIYELFAHIGQTHLDQTQAPANAIKITPAHGGDINQSFRIQTPGKQYFLKVNRKEYLPMFTAESAGLNAIAARKTINTCHPIACGQFQQQSYLLLDALELQTAGDWQQAGQQLALLHLTEAGKQYGFEIDTYCGTTLQPNRWADSWADFFAKQRIGFQLDLLGRYSQQQRDRIVSAITRTLEPHHPKPALVHGDLWSGNIGFCNGQPVIFDPACYIGDSETDLAMTELFGRFPEAFYQGYNNLNPIDTGYRHRRDIYQLYHLLNHANLFGGNYLNSAEQQLKRILEI